jgi:hypothetical protein
MGDGLRGLASTRVPIRCFWKPADLGVAYVDSGVWFPWK